MIKRKNIITGLLITFSILFVFSFFLLNRFIKKSFPEHSGIIKLKGLKNTVRIYRDSFGIPYIEAQNEEDLFFALGFVHAQDRLFQMEIIKRAGMGRLAEILGKDALEVDLMFRIAGFDELAKKLYQNSATESKRICEAYTDGINSYINHSSGNFSIEFDLLGIQPKFWEPYQVYLNARLTAWELNLGWWVDVVFAQIQNKLPQEKIKQLIPDYPDNSPTIIKKQIKEELTFLSKHQNSISKFSEDEIVLLNEFLRINNQLREILGLNQTYSGSNSWAISSTLSQSGKPILANDPHLMYSLPSKWYVVSLNSPTLNASGVTIPGSPSIVIGKNKHIAWGLTNLMLDDCDLIIEKLDSSETKYLVDGEWKDLKIKTDTIYVKNDSNVVVLIKSTHRGPIIQFSNKFLVESRFNKAISMKWTGFELSDELLTFYKINKSKNYKEFREALRTFNCPAQNFLCADSDGNIFYKSAGKIPIREYSNYLFPLDGTSTNYDWKKYLDFEQLPELLNPVEGFIATNNNPPQQSIKYLIGNLWEPASRAERIDELLRSKKRFSVEDFKQFQVDLVSPYAKNVSHHVVKAFENVEIKDKNLNDAIRLFKNWNGELRREDPISAIYNVFMIKLLKNTFFDELDEPLYNQFLFVGNVPLRVIQQLLNNNIPDSISIFDNIKTDKIETKDMIIRESMAEAIRELRSKFGRNMNSWLWGDIHRVKFHHLFSGKNPILDKLINIGPYPIGGDQTTLLNTSYKYYEPYENYLGPSMRQIVDLSDIDKSLIIITGGQSEHIGHENYKDQALMWLNGMYINFNTSKEFYKNYMRLTLSPE